jgi:DNA-binding CsgD family transcriptional regulator
MDAISIIETAYALELDMRGWLQRLLTLVGPTLERGFGVVAFAYDVRSGVDPSTVVHMNTEPRIATAAFAMTNAYPLEMSKTLASHGYMTAAQRLGLSRAEALGFRPHMEYLHPFGIKELISISALDPTGKGLAFSAPTADLDRPKGPEAAMWSRIAVHMAAGWRLRRAVSLLRERECDALQSGPSPSARATDEAVLSPGGDVLHAEGAATDAVARGSLRAAARAIDRARSRVRSNEREALELWQGLVEGRWSLVDQFDGDGRRYLIARRNDTEIPDPRALSLRERQVLAHAALGQSLKVIAYALGLSVATVAEHRARGLRKLGIRSQAELSSLFAATGEADREGQLRAGSNAQLPIDGG